MNKKGQGGINAAVLIAIIAALIILYIIFLPTSERENVLGENSGSSSDGGSSVSSVSLLKTNPGKLTSQGDLENEKQIPNVFLVETSNAKELDRINPFIVRNGWFDTKDSKIEFSLDEPENTDNAVLSFGTKKRQGVLTIKLNGVIIFENELTSDIPEPVKLDRKLLQKANSLEFSVSSVGAKFWQTNEYSLENIKIIGDITDTSRQASENVFDITESEFSNLERATLRFAPYCSDTANVGLLEIFVNTKKVFSSVPVCDNPYKQSLPKSLLNQGENNIVFKTKKGSYSIEQIRVALDFKSAASKTYYFELTPEQYSAIKSGSKSVIATLKFVDDKTQKRLKLDVNGKAETIETDKDSVTKAIGTKVSEGNNYIKIDPFEDLELVELKVDLN